MVSGRGKTRAMGVSNTAVQNSQSNSTKQITTATSWAPRTLSLARPVHSQKLRSKGRSLSLYLYLYLSPATFAIRASCFEISPLSSPRFILPDFLSVPPAEYRTFWLLDQRFWLVVHLEWNEEAGFRCSRPSNRLG